MSRVREIMTPGVDVIAPTATTADAARNMKNLDVGAIPVCEGENLLGMVTDRDLVLRVMADGRNPLEAKVGEVMTPGLYFCYDDEEVETAAALMSEKQIRRLPVLSRTQRLVGIVSLGDLAVDALTTQTSGAVLHNVSDPSQSGR